MPMLKSTENVNASVSNTMKVAATPAPANVTLALPSMMTRDGSAGCLVLLGGVKGGRGE